MKPILQVQNLEVEYHTPTGKLKALHDVSFDVQPGEILGIVGESGCGKSTVSSAILRLLPANGSPSAGKILYKDQDILEFNPEELRQLRGRDISIVFQDPMACLNPSFTIGQQMIDIQKAHQFTGNADMLRRKAVSILEKAGVPDANERFDHYPHQFSGGMRQRILIAMALLSEPSLLIADEPTSALDVTLEAQILEMIKELRSSFNTAILFISHDLGVIAQLCDRLVVMYAGRVVEQGDIFSLYKEPLHPYTRALLASVPSRLSHGRRLATIPGRVPSLSALPKGCKFSERCPFSRDICTQMEPEIYKAGSRHVRCFAYQENAGYDLPAAPDLPAEEKADSVVPYLHHSSGASQAAGDHRNSAMVDLQGLSVHFPESRSLLDVLAGRKSKTVKAVDRVDLQIKKGEIFGLVGESGCGKTTIGKTMLGLIPATEGQLHIAGKDPRSLSGKELRNLRSRIQMIFQDPLSSLSPRLKVSSLLTEPYKIHHTRESEQYSVQQLLAMVGLSGEQSEKYPHQISGGQARRIGIARALTLHPEFIIADEPTSGLDVSVSASIINLLKDLANQFGLTYLIISHNLNVVGYISDRTGVMYLGNLVEVGNTAELFEQPFHPYTLALLSSISEPDPMLRFQVQRIILKGEIPSPRTPPSGCRFHTRCPFAEEACKIQRQELVLVEPDHWVACRRWQEIRGASWPRPDAVNSIPERRTS
jgi:peptide/nickel transport system ATP-binding protein